MGTRIQVLCSCCGKDYERERPTKGNREIRTEFFYVSRSPLYKANETRLTICRDCVDKLFEEYLKKFNNKADAFYCLCSQLGWYFSEKRYNDVALDNFERGVNLISAYVRAINLGKGNNDRNKTFADTLAEENDRMNAIGASSHRYRYSDKPIDEADLEHMRLRTQRWGEGLAEKDYQFLEGEYGDWAQNYNCGEKNMQFLIEEICLTKLTIRQKRERGESVEKEQKTLLELMGSSSLKPIQETGANAAEQSTFGNFIKHIENDRPIAEPEDEFKDVDYILKYIRTWFLGHMAKILGKQNEYSKEYEAELEKYTVEAPTFKDDD